MSPKPKKTMLNLIKQEFQEDEKLLENAFRIERLLRKYKYVLIALVGILIAWLGYRAIYNSLQESKTEKISALYNELAQNPNNELLQRQLQELDSRLYDLYRLSRIDSLSSAEEPLLSELANSANPLVREIASYNLASLRRDKLTEVQSGALNDLARIQQAYLLIQKGAIPEARKELEQIPPESKLYPLATQMKHYGIIKHPLEQELHIKEVPAPNSGARESTQDSTRESTQESRGLDSAKRESNAQDSATKGEK